MMPYGAPSVNPFDPLLLAMLKLLRYKLIQTQHSKDLYRYI